MSSLKNKIKLKVNLKNFGVNVKRSVLKRSD
jgi:hypothetical protein